MMTNATNTSLIALDVGEKRVGVAVASHAARLPRSLITLRRDEHFWERLQKILQENLADILVIGLPRNMSGKETAQSATIRTFASELKEATGLPIVFQDETLSSQEALGRLEARGKPFRKEDIDAMAAELILEDHLNNSANAER